VVSFDANGGHRSDVTLEVRCLACEHVYTRSLDGSVPNEVPDCPHCGYAGWVAVSVPFERPSPPHHFGADPPPLLGAPPR
jgi:hypothetical protein